MSTTTEHRDPSSLTQVSARTMKGSSTRTGSLWEDGACSP